MFFKKKKIVLEAYAPVGDLIDLFPIVESSKCIPTWYTKLPPSDTSNPNVRSCFGLKDLYKKGIIIPLWSDYDVTIDPMRGISAVSGMQNQATFPPLVSNDIASQTGGAWPNYANLKFNSPWLFWCSEPIQWVWVQPVWWQKDPQQMVLVTASAEFRGQHDSNISTLIKMPNQTETISFKAGLPMAQLIPLTEEPWELKNMVMTKEIFDKKFAHWEFSLNPKLRYPKIRNILNRKQ
jgi:hypothetical protein